VAAGAVCAVLADVAAAARVVAAVTAGGKAGGGRAAVLAGIAMWAPLV
jgi:hypothetical protein